MRGTPPCMSKIQGVCGSADLIQDSHGSLYSLGNDGQVKSVGGWFGDFGNWLVNPSGFESGDYYINQQNEKAKADAALTKADFSVAPSVAMTPGGALPLVLAGVAGVITGMASGGGTTKTTVTEGGKVTTTEKVGILAQPLASVGKGVSNTMALLAVGAIAYLFFLERK